MLMPLPFSLFEPCHAGDKIKVIVYGSCLDQILDFLPNGLDSVLCGGGSYVPFPPVVASRPLLSAGYTPGRTYTIQSHASQRIRFTPDCVEYPH